MERDPILLTPGPLTTTDRTKRAMLRDWGSWDTAFIALTAELRRQLLAVVHGEGSHVVVPLQGSGTFSVEAAVATIVPRDGHVLVLDNGAYCKRMGKLATLMGRRTTIRAHAEDAPVSPDELDAALAADPSITHVGFIHCETGTGVQNPLHAGRRRLRAARQGPHRRRHELVRGAAHRRARDPLRRARRRQRQVPGRCARNGLRVHPPGGARRLRRPLALAGDGPARPARLHGEDGPVALHAADARDGRPARGDAAVRGGGRAAGAARPLPRQLRRAADRHGRARLRAFPRRRDPGAGDRHLPCARRPGVRVPRLLRGGAGSAATSSIRAS